MFDRPYRPLIYAMILLYVHACAHILYRPDHVDVWERGGEYRVGSDLTGFPRGLHIGAMGDIRTFVINKNLIRRSLVIICYRVEGWSGWTFVIVI